MRLAGPAVKPDGTWGIRNMPNHKEIATWAGTIPATVARVIGRLAPNGVVERHHKTLYINDYFRLRQLAQSLEEGEPTGSRAVDVSLALGSAWVPDACSLARSWDLRAHATPNILWCPEGPDREM